MGSRFNIYLNSWLANVRGTKAIAMATLAAAIFATPGARAGSIFDDDYVPPARTAPADPARPTPDAPPSDTNVPTPAPTPVPAPTPTPARGTDPAAPTPPVVPDASSPMTASSTETPGRRAVPAAADQSKSRKLFKEVFATELANHTSAARRALAEKLLQQSSQIHDAPSDRFVLLVGASQAGKEAGDLDVCCKAADALATAYDVDGLRMKCDTAMKMTLRADTATATADNCRVGLKLVDELIGAADFPAGLKLLQMLRPIAADRELTAEIQGRTRQIESLRLAAERIAPALQKLKTAPDDPGANLTVGEYLCFSKDDWKNGLPLLIKGGKPAISAAAAIDLANPADADKQMEAGDAWWTAAEKETGTMQVTLRQRAAAWYGKAMDGGGVTGLKRVLVEKRVAEANAAGPAVGTVHATAAMAHVTIISAEYGDGKRMASVGKRVQAALDKDPFTPIAATSDAFKTDPAPYVHKKLVLAYRVGGVSRTLDVSEDDVIILPPIPKEGVALADASISFKIVAARYGVDDHWLDVTDAMRGELINPSAPLKTHNMADGKELHNGITKRVVVYFEVHGRRYVNITREGDSMTLIPR